MAELKIIVTESAIKDRIKQLESQLIDFCTNVLGLEEVEITLKLEE